MALITVTLREGDASGYLSADPRPRPVSSTLVPTSSPGAGPTTGTRDLCEVNSHVIPDTEAGKGSVTYSRSFMASKCQRRF